MKDDQALIHPGHSQRPWFPYQIAVLVTLLVTSSHNQGAAQSLPRRGVRPPRDNRPLSQREPYDVITLTEANRGVSVKVLPLDFPIGGLPETPDPNSTVRVRLYSNDEKEYEVYWRDIATIEQFPALLLREAERLTSASDFAAAYHCFARLFREYPRQAELNSTFDAFLFAEGNSLIREDNYFDALTSLEALRIRNPSYSPPDSSVSLTDLMSQLVDRVAETYFQAGDLRATRAIVRRIRSAQPSSVPPAIERWEQRLASLAAEKRAAAQSALEVDDFRAARVQLNEAIAIWPQAKGLAALEAELADRYPVIAVAVLQPFEQQLTEEFGSWPQRRTSTLMEAHFIEFMGTGAEGGSYRFPLGRIEQTDDRRSLNFHLSSQAEAQGWSGYEVADHLASLAGSDSSAYRPAWGSLLASLEVHGLNRVRANLRRSHVLPQALLCGPLLPEGNDSGTGVSTERNAGPFHVAERSASTARFRPRDPAGSQFAEIVERTYEDSRTALSALRGGNVDVVDRLFPADAARLINESEETSLVAVEPYQLPSVHMLLINENNPFLKNSDFRRALVYGIDRATILQSDLLGGEDLPGCELVSGPFPKGAGNRDPLAYAYDTSIETRSFIPQLAKVLALLGHSSVSGQGHVWQALTIGCPPHETARVTCGAIVAQLAAVGIEAELKEVRAGRRPSDAGVDLLYAEIVMREPLVDAHRLLGETGLSPSSDPIIRHALRQLQNARSWSEVRAGLLEIHRAVHEEVTIIPLWQTIDYLAFRRVLRNVGERPLTLYQQIDAWRMGRRQEAE